MNKYRMVWFNYIAQEDQTELILAKDEKDAHEIAIMYIRLRVGHDDDFAGGCLTSLYEECENDFITREEVEEELKQKSKNSKKVAD